MLIVLVDELTFITMCAFCCCGCCCFGYLKQVKRLLNAELKLLRGVRWGVKKNLFSFYLSHVRVFRYDFDVIHIIGLRGKKQA